jgi:hypothetical protein
MLGSSGMGPRFGRDVWWERRYKKVWVIVLDTFPVRDGGDLETTTPQLVSQQSSQSDYSIKS